MGDFADKDKKQQGEDLSNASEKRESQIPSTPTKPKEAQTDVDQVMLDRSDDQTAHDGNVGPIEPLKEAAKCNGTDDAAVTDPPARPADEIKDTKDNNGESGVTKQPPENAHVENQPTDADAEKISIPKPLTDKNVAEVKNGFDDVEVFIYLFIFLRNTR